MPGGWQLGNFQPLDQMPQSSRTARICRTDSITVLASMRAHCGGGAAGVGRRVRVEYEGVPSAYAGVCDVPSTICIHISPAATLPRTSRILTVTE